MDNGHIKSIKTKLEEMREQKEIKKSNGIKFVLIGLGVVGLSVGGYFAYRHLTKDRGLDSSFIPDQTTNNESYQEAKTTKGQGGSTVDPSGFPLKKGSRGKYVGQLQSALARKFGIKVLGSGGIDKIFGKDTERALTSNGLPKVISSRVFEDFIKVRTEANKGGTIIKNSEQRITVSRPKDLAWNLRDTILKGRFDLALEKLTKIRTVKDYDLVNEFFKEWLVFGVRKTIVTALLQKFTSSSDKKKLTVHFNRMGLVKNKDSGKWSNKGTLGIIVLGQPEIKSIRTAKVWNAKGDSINVPAQMILGEFLNAVNGVTEFSTIDDKVLFIKTQNISYV